MIRCTLLLFIAACAADLEFDDDTLVRDIRGYAEFCDSLPSTGPRVVVCKEKGATFELDLGWTPLDCSLALVNASATCEATVGDVRACEEAWRTTPDSVLCDSLEQALAACEPLTALDCAPDL